MLPFFFVSCSQASLSMAMICYELFHVCDMHFILGPDDESPHHKFGHSGVCVERKAADKHFCESL